MLVLVTRPAQRNHVQPLQHVVAPVHVMKLDGFRRPAVPARAYLQRAALHGFAHDLPGERAATRSRAALGVSPGRSPALACPLHPAGVAQRLPRRPRLAANAQVPPAAFAPAGLAVFSAPAGIPGARVPVEFLGRLVLPAVVAAELGTVGRPGGVCAHSRIVLDGTHPGNGKREGRLRDLCPPPTQKAERPPHPTPPDLPCLRLATRSAVPESNENVNLALEAAHNPRRPTQAEAPEVAGSGRVPEGRPVHALELAWRR